MICKKCKNKKATYFYTEGNGERKALCAECSALIIRSCDSEFYSKDADREIYTPTLELVEYERFFSAAPIFFGDVKTKSLKCKACEADELYLKKTRRVGCSECYSAFSQYISPPSPEEPIRLPRIRREKLESARMIKELKEKMRIAAVSEDFESAAKLRDRIKLLEADAV